MQYQILSEEQQHQLTLLAAFKREFVLVGGTAIAMYIGHRRSIDFDLFKPNAIRASRIKQKFADKKATYNLLFENAEGVHLMVNEVKWTFFQYPFTIDDALHAEKNFRIPDLLTLAAMKAYALGRRAKWKDYVDMFMILSSYYSIAQIAQRATAIFGDAFSEKLFRVQLSYFHDMDYTESVDWLIDAPDNETIKHNLVQMALD